MRNESSLTDTSLLLTAWHRLTSRLTRDDSWLVTQLQSLSAVLATAARASGSATLGTLLTRWIRHSILYRWLTAEPDPEVIVIDLRETYTIGPILAVLDRVVTPLAGAWKTAITSSLTRSAHTTLQRHPIRTVSIIALGALLTEFAVSLISGSLPSTGVSVRLLFVGLTALGSQVRVSWTQCTESVTYRYLAAALEPPEPPETDESDDTNVSE